MTNIKPHTILNSMSEKSEEKTKFHFAVNKTFSCCLSANFCESKQPGKRLQCIKMLFALKLYQTFTSLWSEQLWRENCTMQIAHPTKGCVKMGGKKSWKFNYHFHVFQLFPQFPSEFIKNFSVLNQSRDEINCRLIELQKIFGAIKHLASYECRNHKPLCLPAATR